MLNHGGVLFPAVRPWMYVWSLAQDSPAGLWVTEASGAPAAWEPEPVELSPWQMDGSYRNCTCEKHSWDERAMCS